LNILYIWDADYPWDIRVEKICLSLVAAGHEVHIVSRNLERNPVYEEDKGLHIHRTKAWNNSRLNNVFSFPAFFNPVWGRLIDSIISRHSIDIIIVRDLPIAIAGIWAGKRYNLPVIFDMAEDYVALLRGIWQNAKFKGGNFLLRNPYIAKLVERYVFRKVDYFLVVVEEAKNVVIAAGVPDKCISIVSNTPELAKFEGGYKLHVTSDVGDRIRGSYSAIYTGGVQKGRGIQTVIEAIPLIIKKIPEFLFVIVGDGYAVDYFKKLAKEAGVEEYILWVGWVDHEELFAYINDSKVGLIPHFSSEHVNSTIPNKLFDYMALALPVLVSDALPLDRIVRVEECGLSYKSGDADALQESLFEIYNSDRDFGAHGKEAVKRKYNWKTDENELLRVIHLF